MQALWSYDKDQGPQPLGLSKEAQRHYRQKKTSTTKQGDLCFGAGGLGSK